MSKREKNFAVTAIDIGETCDGHARLIGLFDTHEEAEAFVKEDMKDVLATMGADEDTIIKWDAHEVWADKHYGAGCIWDILDLNEQEEHEADNGK